MDLVSSSRGKGPMERFQQLGARDSNWGAMFPARSYHFDKDGHVPGFNESRNFGLGVTYKIHDSHQTWDWQRSEAFGVGYLSSYAVKGSEYEKDVALVAGVNWDPLKVDMGPLQVKLGLSAGLSTSTQGAYADMNPDASRGTITALAGLHTEFKLGDSNLSVQSTIIPPIAGGIGVVAASFKYKF